MKTFLLALFTTLARLVSGELLKLIQNKRVQALALKAAEAAAKLDIDGDGKRDHARADLKNEAIAIGILLRDSYANALIELAVSKLKERAEKDAEQ
jgi:hypothetical protein